jgi:gas vesicle protein
VLDKKHRLLTVTCQERMFNMDSDTRYVMLAGLALMAGVVLGTGLGLLIAPQSGSRTRRQLKNMMEDASERAGEFADDAKEVVSDIMERSKKFVV